jgi:hypothetical protein
MTTDDYLPSQVNACLLPVVGGVGIASAADLNFTWDCFAFAMGSNLAFSLRGVLSKKLSKKTDKGENMDDPGNAFAVMTAFAFLAVLPIALAIEGPSMATEWDKAMAKGVSTAGPALHAYAHHGAISMSSGRALRALPCMQVLTTAPSLPFPTGERTGPSLPLGREWTLLLFVQRGLLLRARLGAPDHTRGRQHHQARHPHLVLCRSIWVRALIAGESRQLPLMASDCL